MTKVKAETAETEETIESTESSVDSIVSDIIENEPMISEHVIDNEMRKESERVESETEAVNSFPGFDPEIHAVDKRGQPIKTAAGAFRKKSGRKSGANVAQPKAPSQLGNINAKVADTMQQKVDASTLIAAKAAANLTFQLGLMLGGEEWQPTIDHTTGHNEPLMLETAYKDYFISEGITDFPPGVALVMALGVYAGPRFLMPTTKTRLQKFTGWCKGFFGKKKTVEKSEPVNRAEKVA